MIRHIESGKGWRIGWNPSAEAFCGLLAGEHWAIELTADELNDFCHSVRQLDDMMQSMAIALMDEENLTCEQETSTIWVEADGFPAEYSLRFILLSGRKGEGAWPAEVVNELVSALIKDPFCNLGHC